jgi:hypothetical protein
VEEDTRGSRHLPLSNTEDPNADTKTANSAATYQKF